MSNFKIKHDKVSNDSHVNTLDENHIQLTKIFQEKKDTLPNKKNELDQLKKLLNSYNNKTVLENKCPN